MLPGVVLRRAGHARVFNFYSGGGLLEEPEAGYRLYDRRVLRPWPRTLPCA